METLPIHYNAKDVEKNIYDDWERGGLFSPKNRRGEGVFSVVLPPPNVTGNLHMGHALNITMQDALVRYHRMKGMRQYGFGD